MALHQLALREEATEKFMGDLAKKQGNFTHNVAVMLQHALRARASVDGVAGAPAAPPGVAAATTGGGRAHPRVSMGGVFGARQCTRRPWAVEPGRVAAAEGSLEPR